MDTMRLARLEGQAMARYEREHAQPVAVKAPVAVRAPVPQTIHIHGMEQMNKRIADLQHEQAQGRRQREVFEGASKQEMRAQAAEILDHRVAAQGTWLDL